MSELNAQEALLLLKKKGSELEKKLNETIQDELNNKEFIELFNLTGPILAKRIEDIQEYVEIFSAILNFPTKKDHYNLANLVIQLEEKIDQIEEYLYELNKSLDDMKVIKYSDHAFEKENPTSYHASSNDSSVSSSDSIDAIEDLEKPFNDDPAPLNQSLNEMKHTPDALDNESEQENLSKPNENSNDDSTFTSDIKEENEEEQGKTSNPDRTLKSLRELRREMKHTPEALDNESEQENHSKPNENSNDDSTFTSDIKEENEEQGKTSNDWTMKSLRELHRERILKHLSDLINLYKKDEE
ncbi:hypothetical protein ABES25_13615 [Bacillus gobiensis]|uniref:hypothetical protein n=1 Tax=Bacillus gobiensis TaxID=1441095 RepID=UPI003D19C9F4